jgi:hypothetical protein
VHKADSLESGKDDIGSAWQVWRMQAEAYPFSVQCLAKPDLGLSVLALDARHHPRSGSGIYDVSHEAAFTFKTEPGMTCVLFSNR